ncbi:hypothetical protein CYMTET_21876 [Cymbomonas tetramitiformis]|uniref:EF-hand domain-containing protein n=1 Tax=Cymbomonas tetramitiformis TaxID=36881 RepID=A0AAE0G1Q2_9CHLO|nr:hypothetical protein CYMTET_21876 [Cymbomonas tetramitiformis]
MRREASLRKSDASRLTAVIAAQAGCLAADGCDRCASGMPLGRRLKTPFWQNLWVCGRFFGSVNESDNMWAALTAGNANPYLEFDFIGDDHPQLNSYDKLVKELLVTRFQQMHPYWLEHLYKECPWLDPDKNHVDVEEEEFGEDGEELVLPEFDLPKPTILRTRLGRRGALPNIMRPEEVGIIIPGRDENPTDTTLAVVTVKDLLEKSPLQRQNPYQIHWDTLMKALVQKEAPMMPVGKTPMQCMIFDAMDEDEGGEITLDELTEKWRDVFGSLPAKMDLMRLFGDMDTNKNGQVNWPEFEMLFCSKHFALTAYEIRTAANKFANKFIVPKGKFVQRSDDLPADVLQKLKKAADVGPKGEK